MRPTVTGVLVVLFASLAGCTSSSTTSDAGDPGAGVLSCFDASEVVVARLQSAASTLQSCATDADCASVEPIMNCTARDVQIVDCPVAVASTRQGDFAAEIDSIAADLCERIEASCHSTPACPDLPSAVCVSGTCELQ